MHVWKATRRRGPILVVLLLALLVAALAFVTTGGSSTGKKHAGPVLIGKGGGFGEVYQARQSTLAKTLFNATLLPANPQSRRIALAGLGRADKKVNYDLALKCWKNNNCSTGTGGKACSRILSTISGRGSPCKWHGYAG